MVVYIITVNGWRPDEAVDPSTPLHFARHAEQNLQLSCRGLMQASAGVAARLLVSLSGNVPALGAAQSAPLPSPNIYAHMKAIGTQGKTSCL
jgi:hypothetical protein